MIMDNTLIVAAGAAVVFVPRYWAWLRHERLPRRLVRAPADHSGGAELFMAMNPGKQAPPAPC